MIAHIVRKGAFMTLCGAHRYAVTGADDESELCDECFTRARSMLWHSADKAFYAKHYEQLRLGPPRPRPAPPRPDYVKEGGR